MIQKVIWILRIGVFGTFLGHGLIAVSGNEGWLPYLEFVKIDGPVALQVMFIIGIVDILVAFSTLVKPTRYVIIYAIIWAFCTALVRPLSGESWIAFVERAANWAAPVALYMILFWEVKR